MSEFLMVIPAGWVELDDAQTFVDEMSEVQILDLIAQNNQAAIEAVLQDTGRIPADAAMQDFRMFRDGGVNRIWLKLG